MAEDNLANGDDSLKRRLEDSNGGDQIMDVKKLKSDEAESTNPLKFLAYKDLPYEDQLKKKMEEVEVCFKAFHQSFPKQYPELNEWHRSQLMKWFKVEDIRASPKTEGYRNKCELTIGYNPEFGKLGAGVRTSDVESERVEINTTDDSFIHLPKSMITVAQEFSGFLEPYNGSDEKCPYLYLYIRCNSKDELMAMVIVSSENDTTEEFGSYKEKVVKFFTEDVSLKEQIKSVYLQARPEGCTKKSFEITFTHAWGAEHLIEEFVETQVLVTPTLFFNINTYAAEVIYQNVIELADCRKKKTLVIDLFCGCGVLSMILSKKARQVIAIDPSKWNIKQAKAMAAHNNIKNIQFVIGKPEEALSYAWSNIVQAEEVIIICDPPQNSKPRYYINVLGDINNLTKLIYLNSNSRTNVVKNLMSLTEAALLPVRAIPVDIAPHTVRLEIVVLCKKFDAYQISRSLNSLDGEEDALPLPPPGHRPPGGGWGGNSGSGSFSGMGGFGLDLEEIERRAFAMGLAKGVCFGGGGSRGGGSNFYDDYPSGGGGRLGSGGYGGGPPASSFGRGFGRMGYMGGGRGGAWSRGGRRGRGGR